MSKVITNKKHEYYIIINMDSLASMVRFAEASMVPNVSNSLEDRDRKSLVLLRSFFHFHKPSQSEQRTICLKPNGKNTHVLLRFLSTPKLGHLHPFTWNIIMEVLKIIFLSKWVICSFHVNLPGCKSHELKQKSWGVPCLTLLEVNITSAKKDSVSNSPQNQTPQYYTCLP